MKISKKYKKTPNAWHNLDQVDDCERERNKRIEKAQRNTNEFIKGIN